jgi:hypothetical protein
MDSRTISRALAFSILTVGMPILGADLPVAPTAPAPAATNGIGPKIQFQTLAHDFGPVMAGKLIKYSYVFTNLGDQSLELRDVQTCGCITTEWTKTVAPGKTGRILASFDSTPFGGQLAKTITVNSNDRTNSKTVLQFAGTVWRPVDFNPTMVILNLAPEASYASATVRLTNNLPEPVTLSAPESDNPTFAAELKTIQPGREYEVVIALVFPLPPGRLRAQITLKTSTTNMPEVSFPAYVNMLPAVTVTPFEISLPPAPLAQPQTNILNLIDNSTNALALSEPTVNAAGVDVQLKELVRGRSFTATLIFPQGFEVAPGQCAELSIKSSLPQLPILKVPILQPPRPVPPQAVPAR